MASTIPNSMQNMSKTIEDEPFPWYLVNVIVEPDTGEIIQYKYLIQSKEEEPRYLCQSGMSKECGRLIDGLPEKIQRGMNTILFVARNNIPAGLTVTYS